MLHQRGHARSKVDYYPQHLFIRVLNHTLASDDDASSANSFSHLPRSESPTNISDDEDDDDSEFQFGKVVQSAQLDADEEKTVYGSANPSRFSTMRAKPNAGGLRRRFTSTDVESSAPIQGRFAGMDVNEKAQKNARNRKLVRELKRGDRVNVKIQPLCLFLFRDGTVISMHKGESYRSLPAPCLSSSWRPPRVP